MGAMNSCGSMHGVVMHDNSSVHVNSCGALEHRKLEFLGEQRC